MDIIKKMLMQLTLKDTSSVYLREIALLMEEMDELKGRLLERDKLIKYYENRLREDRS